MEPGAALDGSGTARDGQQADGSAAQHAEEAAADPAAARGPSASDGPPLKRARTDENGGAAGADEEGGDAADVDAGDDADGDARGPRQQGGRDYRLRQRRWWALRRRFSDLTAQVEAALCEAKALIAWRTLPRAPRAARSSVLSAQDREVLAVQHNRRLFDCAGKACLQVIKTMMQQKFSWPFNRPVDVTRFPDYKQVISDPMDFGTMRDKAERGQYRDPSAVYSDFLLVFSNSRKYNPPGSDVYYMATVLQETFLEQWKKVVVPKLQECAKQSATEEAGMVARKLAAVKADEDREMQDAACKLVATLDDLHDQLASVRVAAALACEPLGPEQKAELAAALEALPTAQLEAALGLVLPQMAPHLASAPASDGRREVELDLGRCSALELRQLQSFVAACKAAPPRSEGGGAAAGQQQQQDGQQQGQQQQQQGEPPAEGQAQASAAAAPVPPGSREVSGFPAGMIRDQTLSEHAGVVWPGVLVGAGLKARHVTALPGGEPLPPGARGAAAAGGKGKGADAAAAAAAAAAGAGGPPAKSTAAARRFSDTGTSALRPPLPPQRSRLGQPPTPTQAGQPGGQGQAHAQSPFATQMAAANAGDASQQQQQQQQGRAPPSGGGSTLAPGQQGDGGITPTLSGTGSVAGSAHGGVVRAHPAGASSSGVPATTAPPGGLPSTAGVAVRGGTAGGSGDEVDMEDVA